MARVQPSWMIETDESLLLPTSAGETQSYRIVNGNIEFQAKPDAVWRRLAPTDVLQHVELQTVMAEWLKHRLRDYVSGKEDEAAA